MPEQLQKKYSIDINQKLYEKETEHGMLSVYQTTPHGTLLTLNDDVILAESDSVFYHEMMSHPALFSHPHPKKIAITGAYYGILEEVLKHASVSEIWCVTDNKIFDEIISRYFSQFKQSSQDARVKFHRVPPMNWLMQGEAKSFDIIIQGHHAEGFLQEQYQHYHQALHDDGILVQPCIASLLQFKTLKPVFLNMEQAGFHDWQTLNFPQPSYPGGFRTVVMAAKNPAVKRIREKDIYNRNFQTRYYNFDTHKSALALPEFAREALGVT